MSLLDGSLATLFGGIFSSQFVDGSLVDPTETYDDEGNLTVVDTAGIACKLQVDKVTESMRQAEGYTSDDVMLIVLAEPGDGLPTLTNLESGYTLSVESGPHAGKTYTVASPVERDAAGVGWTARGTPRNG